MGVVQDGLVLWLDARAQRQLIKMGQSDSVWKDLSGNGNDGQLVNFDFTENSGWVDGGLKFDGVDDYVDLGLIDLREEMTLDMIIELNLTDQPFNRIFTSTNDSISLFTIGNNKAISVKLTTSQGSVPRPVASIEFGKVMQVTFNYSTSTGLLKLYIDGELKSEVQRDGTPINNSSPYTIGYVGRGGSFSGKCLSLKLYNRALTDEEILQNYRATHFRLEPKTFTSNDYYNYYDLNRVEINTLATKDLAEVLRGDINLEDIVFDRDMKSIPFADVLNKVEKNINTLGNKLYKPKDWVQPKLDWRYNQPFSYEDANRLERNLLLLYNFAKGNIDNIPHCGMYTCGEEVV